MTMPAYRLPSLLLIACLAGGALSATAEDLPSGALYRYTNDQGVRVLSQSIPPEFVRNGYEILSRTGQVLRVVDPAPSDAALEEAVESRRRQAELDRWDSELRRRYSTVADIEAAKTRGLAELQGNISILRGNLHNIGLQIEQQESEAARQERAGRAVSDTVLQNLRDLASEQEEVRAQIRQREEEMRGVAERFDRDIARFEQISAQRNGR